MRLEKGETIGGRYSLVRAIGEGGMGAVWAALDTKQNELVALKVLRAQTKAPDLVRRFLREARAAMAVKHPNVVRIREVVTVDDEPIIVMDYLEGESLAARLDKVGRLPLSEFAQIFVAVVSAIGTAHAAGIVHRDLKPDNLFLVRLAGGAEEPRVVDFGIAKLTAIEGDAKQSGHLTTTGSVLGTPYYMSPEQVFGDKSIDHRTDVWSLGTIAFECLSGRRPVDGDNIGQLLKVITTGAIPRLEDVISGLPPEIYELVGRMLSYDRANRPYDLREVLNVFARHTDHAAQSFGEVTLLPGAMSAPDPTTGPRVSALAATLVDPPSFASSQPSAAAPAFGSTTGGAALPSIGGVTAQPSRGRVAAFSAVGFVVLAVGAFVGVRALRVAPASPDSVEPYATVSAVGSTPMTESSAATNASTTNSPGGASPSAPPASASAVPASASPSHGAAANGHANAGHPSHPSATAKPATTTTSAAGPSPTVTPSAAGPSPTSPRAPSTGAPVATDNPYR